MKFLYLALNIGSFFIPFLYSFHPKMNFIRHWKKLFLSTFIVAVIFLAWDAFFTKNGIWGFNDTYHLNILLLKMPIEEWMFFFCIPYASIFINYSLEHFKPNWLLSQKTTQILTLLLLLLTLALTFCNVNRWYTVTNYGFLSIVLLLGYFYGQTYLRRFYIAFLFILIPFFLVNGILTGSFIPEQVVWYNDDHNLGIRLGTIPVEDIGYAFSMLFLNLLIFEKSK